MGLLFGVAALSLCVFAFGFGNCLNAAVWSLGAILHLVGVGLSPHGFALVALVALCLVSVAACFWLGHRLLSRFGREGIGLFVVTCGVVLWLLAFGSSYEHVTIDRATLTGMVLIGFLLFCIGTGIVRTEQPESEAVQETAPAAAAAPDYIYGDARAAYDHEIHQAARGHSGGFGPMFDD